jgi:uncharacterized delta-60 repeat protein
MTHKGYAPSVRVERLESRAYLTAGGLDPSFGTGGKVTTDFLAAAPSRALATLALPDGKALAVGYSQTANESFQLAMARFLPDGRLDATFGKGGTVVSSFGGEATGDDVVRLADGRLIVAGILDGKLMVERFSADGVLDSTFGNRGLFVDRTLATNIGSEFIRSFVRVRGDGRIVAAVNSRLNYTQEQAFHVVQLNADGTLDRTFADGGSLALNGFVEFDALAGIELRPDGRLVVGATSSDPSGSISRIVLMQFTQGGRPDKTFAGTGEVRGNVFTRFDELRDIALDKQGRILLLHDEKETFQVARFRTDGVFDRSFGTRGVCSVSIDPDRTSDFDQGAALLAVGENGSILAAALTAPSPSVAETRRQLDVVRLTAAGALDGTYATGGVARVAVANPATLGAMALRSDGKLLAGGSFGDDLAMIRLNADGSADRSFGTNTIATVTPISPASDRADAMAVQADGNVILAGFSEGKDGDYAAIARYQRDGRLDLTFGAGGRVRILLGSHPNFIHTVVVRDDGKIIVAGGGGGGDGGNGGFVARLNPNGSLDSSFSQRGILLIDLPVFAVQRVSGGKFVLICSSIDQQLRRYNADGSIDKTFASAGVLATDGLSGTDANDLLIQRDGKILMAGSDKPADPNDPGQFFAVWRINPNGALDPTFGHGGKVSFDIGGDGNSAANALALQKDGKILVGGQQGLFFSGSNYGLARLNANGTLDQTFGDRGRVDTPFPPSFPHPESIEPTDCITTILVQDDGRIVAAGFDDVDSGSFFDYASDFGLIRYNPDGSLDRTFGEGGLLTTSFGKLDTPAAALITSDGKLIVAGTGQPKSAGSDFALARYLLTDPHPLTAKIDNGLLKITGTDAGETIRLRLANGALKIDGVVETFATTLFSRIEIIAKGGNDAVDASAVNVPLRVDAGAGNDQVIGGGGGDVLLGNAGDDTIFGGGGSDTVRGGDGNDYLSGGPGADQLFGDAGNDQFVAADAAIDQIDGGAGFDRAKSEPSDPLTSIEGVLA